MVRGRRRADAGSTVGSRRGRAPATSSIKSTSRLISDRCVGMSDHEGAGLAGLDLEPEPRQDRRRLRERYGGAQQGVQAR